MDELSHDLAVVWIVIGAVALLVLGLSWVTIATVKRKYNCIHTFVASLIGSRLLFCSVPLMIVAIVTLAKEQWNDTECQLVFWSWTATVLSDLLTVLVGLFFAITQHTGSCARNRKFAVDTSVAVAWLVSTITAGIILLAHDSDSTTLRSCRVIPQEHSLNLTLLILYFSSAVLIVLLGSSAAAYATLVHVNDVTPSADDRGSSNNLTNGYAARRSPDSSSDHQIRIPGKQAGSILHVTASLTVLLSLLPQCILLGITLLQRDDLDFARHILFGTALLHSLALPLGLVIVSRDYRHALRDVLTKRIRCTSLANNMPIPQSDDSGSEAAREAPTPTVPDIVVCDLAVPEETECYDNVVYENIDGPDGLGLGASPGLVPPEPPARPSGLGVNRSTTTVGYSKPQPHLMRSQSQQTRKEWMRMMRRNFLPNIRPQAKPDILSNHVMKGVKSDNEGHIEIDGEEDDISYDYDDIDEVLNTIQDSDDVRESGIESVYYNELEPPSSTDLTQETYNDSTQHPSSDSYIDITKYVVSANSLDRSGEDIDDTNQEESSAASELGTLTKNRISTNPRHRGSAYNDDDNYYNGTLKRKQKKESKHETKEKDVVNTNKNKTATDTILNENRNTKDTYVIVNKHKNIKTKEANHSKTEKSNRTKSKNNSRRTHSKLLVQRSQHVQSDTPPSSSQTSRSSSFNSNQSSSSTTPSSYKNDPFSTEWTQAFLRTQGLGRHSSRVHRPVSRVTTRGESFHSSLRRDRLRGLSRQSSRAFSSGIPSPRSHRSSKHHADKRRQMQRAYSRSSSRRDSHGYVPGPRNPFAPEYGYGHDPYLTHPYYDPYFHKLALMHANMSRPYTLTPIQALHNPYLYSHPSFDMSSVLEDPYSFAGSPPFPEQLPGLHKQFSLDNLSVRSNPFLDYSMGETLPNPTDTNPFKEYMADPDSVTKYRNNPFYMEAPDEIHEDVAGPPESPPAVSTAVSLPSKSKEVKSKWRKAVLALSVVEFLRSKSLKLSVLDNGEKFGAKRRKSSASHRKKISVSSISDNGVITDVVIPSNGGNGYKLQEDTEIELEGSTRETVLPGRRIASVVNGHTEIHDTEGRKEGDHQSIRDGTGIRRSAEDGTTNIDTTQTAGATKRTSIPSITVYHTDYL